MPTKPIKLSTGENSTLGNWLKLSKVVFGDKSPAVSFIEDKIAESKAGPDEPVLADERQFLHVLAALPVDAPLIYER